MADELVFRGVRGRTFEDQRQAIASGYGSVSEMAIDELGLMVLELVKRVEALERNTIPRQTTPSELVDGSGIPWKPIRDAG